MLLGMHILIVDDDEETRGLVGGALERHAHTCVLVEGTQEALAQLRSRSFDVIVLDVMMDGPSGLDLCVELRKSGNATPILFLSARGTVHARVEGLEAGGDDYLPKPFAIRELVARVTALGRRGVTTTPTVFRTGSIVVDFDGRRARSGGREVPITAREWEVLRVLANAKGRVVSFDEILERAWGDLSENARASLEVIVSRLRRKLGGGAAHGVLRTVRGVGYALEMDR